MHTQDDFDWYVRNMAIFLPYFFGKKVNYQLPKYVNLQKEISTSEILKMVIDMVKEV